MKFKDFRVIRAKRTVVGRMICRLIGDEKGAVAMEYVVIALLIVAAAVGAAVYFGKTIKNNLRDTAELVNAQDKNATSAAQAAARAASDTAGKTTANTVSTNMAGTSGE